MENANCALPTVKKIKEMYEKRKPSESTNDQEKVRERKLSTYIKEKVNMYERQAEEYEKMRQNHNLLVLSKKFGFQKFLRRKSIDHPNNILEKTENVKENNNDDNSNANANDYDCDDNDYIKPTDFKRFIFDIQTMCDNYEKELEFLKKNLKTQEQGTVQGGNASNSNSEVQCQKQCNQCEQLSNELEKKNILLKEKEEEIASLNEEISNLKKRYEDFDTHMSFVLNDLARERNENINASHHSTMSGFNLECFKEENIHSTTSPTVQYITDNSQMKVWDNTLLVDIIADSLFIDSISGILSNIHRMNKKILSGSNFLVYLSTIFTSSLNDYQLSEKNQYGYYIHNHTNLALSEEHQHMQEICILLYLVFLKQKKNEKPLKSFSYHIGEAPSNSFHTGEISLSTSSQYDWIITEDDITPAVIKAVAEEYMRIKLNQNTTTSVYDFDRIFESKAFSANRQVVGLKATIRDHFKQKNSAYLAEIEEDICRIAKLVKRHIYAGKLVYRTFIIYDYWKLYNDIQSMDFPFGISNLSKNRINMNNTIRYFSSSNTPEVADNLLFSLKYHSENIDSLYINGSRLLSSKEQAPIETEEDVKNILKFPINAVVTQILTSNLLFRIVSFTITDFELDESNIFQLTKLIELCSNLDILDLSKDMINDGELRLMCEVLKYNKTLTTLHLSYNNITGKGGFYLAEMLLKNSTLAKLLLAGNNITELGLQALTNVLINFNNKIRHLDIANNSLEANDWIYISNLIIKNTENLTCLNLSGNVFDCESINALGLALKENTNLKILILNNIDLTADSTPYFFQHLNETALEEIYLDENTLGEVGGVLFANILKYRSNLKRISLKRTGVTSVSLLCICHAMELDIEKNGSLLIELINLDDNVFDDISIDALLKMIDLYQCRNREKSSTLKITVSGKCLSEKSIDWILHRNNKNLIII